MSADTPRFLPYGRQRLGAEEIEAVVRVLESDWLTQGPAVDRFEAALCEVTGARHAVAVSSGTAALHLTMLALGVGPGDEVVTTPNTFAATANAILYAGARPRFADIDPATWCLDPAAVERLLDGPGSGAVRGVVAVHFGGLPAGIGAIRRLARARGLFVVEDACHALGARWRDAEGLSGRVGEGDAADAVILSFHPVKHITTGEGGAVLTPHAEIAAAIRRLRHHGIERDPERMVARPDGPTPGWYHEMLDLGFNYRASDIHCALGTAQLERLDAFVAERRRLARGYFDRFAGDARIVPQARPDDAESSWHLFAVRVPERDRVYGALRRAGIGCQVHYQPVYRHPYYRSLGYPLGLCPEAERYAAETLSLPLWPGLTDADQDRVADEVTRALDAFAPAPVTP